MDKLAKLVAFHAADRGSNPLGSTIPRYEERENEDNHDIKPVWCEAVKHYANKSISFNATAW